MKSSPRKYGVTLVRGPVVAVPTHRNAVASPAELLDWVSSRNNQRPLAADLFCGAGGLSIGLAAAGYDVVLGVDNDPVALETYAGLHPGLALCRDLSNPEVVDELVELISALGVETIAGGSPCQPFSQAGASKIRSLVQAGSRPAHDGRRDLWRSFLEIVRRVQPRAVLFENVPDLAIAANTTIFRTLVSELEAEGYAVHTALLRSCDHGVPQFRQRLFLVALAKGTQFDWPSPSRVQVTVGDAIGDLPPVEGGWRSPDGAYGFLEYDLPPKPSAFTRRARKGLPAADRRRVYDHITRPVRDDDRVIFESMDSTTRYSEIDESLKRYRDDIFDDKYKRLEWGKPSRSITAHIARDGYWYIHPEQARTLTVREAARAADISRQNQVRRTALGRLPPDRERRPAALGRTCCPISPTIAGKLRAGRSDNSLPQRAPSRMVRPQRQPRPAMDQSPNNLDGDAGTPSAGSGTERLGRHGLADAGEARQPAAHDRVVRSTP